MYKLFITILASLLICCKEVSYKEPQPKGRSALSEIPAELRGNYLIMEEDGTSKDTLIVTRTGYHVTNDSTRAELGDSLVLKRYKGYYFFNDNHKPEWLLRIVKKEKNGNLSYMLMDRGDKSFNDFLFKLNKEIEIDSFEVNNEKLYQIDPSPKQLVGLIRKGYFKKTITLQKLK
ncbi:hypothetical protein [Chryseolinea sp. H1M3-3]|uniref:hypothetical protein n=1 Tax=Chryseolinea sp. H1M3-3 TaxID=3034144 RepID=UPI0023EBB363|nr:hypothetical protein [Chryseolinea sp. H1M3-3]